MAKSQNELVSKADEHYNTLTGDAEMKRLAEIRMLSDMEEHSALTTAKQEGIEEGIKQGMKEGKDININDIIKTTGLSNDEIENI